MAIYFSDVIPTPNFLLESWFWAAMSVTARCWKVPAYLCTHWGQWRWWWLFQFSNSKISLASWGPQTCLLLPARSSQHVKDTGVKQNRLKHYSCCTDGELLIISVWRVGVSKEFSTLWDFGSLSRSGRPLKSLNLISNLTLHLCYFWSLDIKRLAQVHTGTLSQTQDLNPDGQIPSPGP